MGMDVQTEFSKLFVHAIAQPGFGPSPRDVFQVFMYSVMIIIQMSLNIHIHLYGHIALNTMYVYDVVDDWTLQATRRHTHKGVYALKSSVVMMV